MSEGNPGNAKKVFVVHGRNLGARDAMFGFLRAIGLEPIEWSAAISATGSASPYIGQALDAAFEMAQAVVVLLTPDDIAYLRPEYANADDDQERVPTPQARPNVLFEAGMAIRRHPERTVLVELGSLRPFSDVAGRLAVRLDNSSQKRNDLANRLKDAGCDVITSGADWLSVGDFTRGPEDLVVAAAGNVSVTDTDNNRVLKLAIGAASLITAPFADLDHPPDSSHGPLQTACVGGDVRGGAGPARRGWQ